MATLLTPWGPRPGSGLFALKAGTTALSRSRSESGFSWGQSVGPWAYLGPQWWHIASAEDGGCEESPRGPAV